MFVETDVVPVEDREGGGGANRVSVIVLPARKMLPLIEKPGTEGNLASWRFQSALRGSRQNCKRHFWLKVNVVNIT